MSKASHAHPLHETLEEREVLTGTAALKWSHCHSICLFPEQMPPMGGEVIKMAVGDSDAPSGSGSHLRSHFSFL